MSQTETIPESSTILTEEVAVQTLRQIVEEAGEGFTYTPPSINEWDGGSCVYKVDGEPSCIVGQLVSRLYPEQFEALGGIVDGKLVGPMVKSSSMALIASEESPVATPITAETPALAIALRQLQSKQDAGMPWDQAFEEVFGD